MSIRAIGHDIIEIKRVKKSIENSGDRFLNRIFTKNEIAYCQAKSNSYESYAARFAAKEAFSKALGTGIGEAFSWKDIEILNEESGKPTILCSNQLLKQFPDIQEIHLSLSHSRELASAFVILET